MTTEILHNRYERGRLIGSGGMGEVFEGYDRLLTREVALKVLRSVYASDPTFLKRFEREAQAAAALAHPNIVGVYDFGVHGGSPFIVMEYVRGQTLRDLLDVEERLAPERAIRMAMQACDALGVAHDRGIVHRDIKPSNIMVTAEDGLKVMDFGIAQAGGLDKITTPTAVLGTAKYISPEHAARLDVDARSDLYSLGVCLYEMLTGRAPFQDLLPVAIVYCHVNEPPRPPRELNVEIPEALEAVVLRTLAKRPDDRYHSAEELAEDLERAAHGWPLAAPTVATSIAAMLSRPDAASGPAGGDGANGQAQGPPGVRPSGGAVAAAAVGPGNGATTSGRLPRWLWNGHARRGDDTPQAAEQPGAGAAPAMAPRATPHTPRPRPDVWAAQPRADAPAAKPAARPGARRWPLLVAAGVAVAALIAAIPLSLSLTGTPAVQREVPGVVGLPLPDALTWLSAAGLDNVDVQPMSDRSRRDLKVVSQRPGPGVRVDSSHLVVLEVVAPGSEVIVPAVRGKTIAAATNALEGAGLMVLDEYQWVEDTSVDAFRVIGTRPGAGTRRRAGEEIRLVVSSGPGRTDGSGIVSGVIGPAPTTVTSTPALVTPQPAGGAAAGGTSPGPTAGATIPPKPTGTGGDDQGPAPTTASTPPETTSAPPPTGGEGGLLGLVKDLLD